MNIRYIKHENIDKKLWDNCINSSQFPMIYASSDFLDIVSPNWAGIVLGNYETVMPVTFRKKLGISYVFRPVLTQQLGVFGKHESNAEIITEFLNILASKFKLIDISLNYLNFHNEFTNKFGITHYLSLDKTYQETFKNFSTNHRRNIRNAEKANLQFTEQCSFTEFDEFIKQNPEEWIKNLEPKYLNEILKNIKKLEENNLVKFYSIKNELNKTIAISVFSQYEKQLSYLFGISSVEGKNKSAMFLMFSNIIKIHSNSNLIFDFEGSEISSIARFFKGFGGIETKFPKIFINKLPRPIKFLKNKKEY